VGGAAISLALTAALCVALLAVTALVGGGAGSHGWSLGHGLLLLCHLG
jgi:hypothetical protein